MAVDVRLRCPRVARHGEFLEPARARRPPREHGERGDRPADGRATASQRAERERDAAHREQVVVGAPQERDGRDRQRGEQRPGDADRRRRASPSARRVASPPSTRRAPRLATGRRGRSRDGSSRRRRGRSAAPARAPHDEHTPPSRAPAERSAAAPSAAVPSSPCRHSAPSVTCTRCTNAASGLETRSYSTSVLCAIRRCGIESQISAHTSTAAPSGHARRAGARARARAGGGRRTRRSTA